MAKRLSGNPFIIEQLEPRLLFSADFEPVTFDGGLPYEDSVVDFSVVETPLVPNSVESRDSVDAEHQRHEIVFVDAGVSDYQQFVDDLSSKQDDGRQVEVLVLDSSRDGINQISEILARYQDLDAVHVLSHGADGAVQMGNTWLRIDTIDAYADAIEGWQDALSSEADLLFYGCDLAAGAEGRDLINSLTLLTGADVAASNDITGNDLIGGDWDLEYVSGNIETGVAFSAHIQESWTGLLATTTIGDGTAPVDRNVWGGGYQFGVNSFTLSTDSGTDTLTDLTVTFSGTDVNDVRSTGVGGVAIWRDDGLTPDQWDINDTQIGSTVSFIGNTASFSGLTESINTTATQYLVTYNIDGNATAGNILQGSATAATVSNTLVNSDNVDATLTVDAGYVHETSVYKFVYGPGIGEELYLKNSSSPNTNILQGMSIGSLYSTGPWSLLMSFDPDATVTSIVNNSAVEQVQMSGWLMDSTGNSYGTVTSNITFYEDRFVFDMNVSVTSNPSGTDWLFMSYATWDGVMDSNFLYSGNSNPFANQTASYTISGQSEPISYQTLFEMGATDGLVNATLQHDGSFASAGLKNIDNGGGSSYDVAFQKNISAGPLGNFSSSVLYSFDTTNTGLNSTLAEEERDGYFVPATLNFGIAGGDGLIVGDGYAELRGAYTLDDNDADDHVRLEFQTTTTHHAPAFEITNWNGAAPAVITVNGVVKELGIDYNAAVSGMTLYLQYLGNLSANTIFEIGDDSISGTVYSDEGITPIAGKTVRMLVNGVDSGTTTTDANGRYAFFQILAASDTILVYIDGDDGATDDGTTVTVIDGDSLTGLDIYVDHLITRHDNAGSLTNAMMDTAKGAYLDPEILYSLDASDNLTVETDTEIYVAIGHNYNPGANVTSQGSAGNMDVRGALNGGTSTFTITGDWHCTIGTFTGDSSTVVMTGSANDITSNGTLGTVINNLTISAGATITARNTFWFDNDLTISGTFNVAAGEQVTMINPNNITINAGGELGGPGAFKQRVGSSPSVHTFNGTISVATYIYEVVNNAATPPGHILTGANYGGDLLITLSGNTAYNYVYIGGGDLTVGGTLTVGSDRTWFGPFTAVLNNAQENRNVTVGNLVIGNSVDSNQYGLFIAGSGNIDVNGDVTILNSDGGGTNGIDAGNSTWNVSGDWTNYNTFTAGTSTVILDGGDQAINGSTTFNNLTKIESSNDSTDSTLTFDNTATQTINGILTLDGLDADDRINLVSDSPSNQWSINLTASAIQGTMDYLDVTDSDASGSDASQITIDPANSIDGGNNDCWFNSAPTIGGTVAGQAVNDNATISPFSGVTLGDVDNPAQTLTVSVTLDVAAKGTFTTLNGFTDAGGGVYTFSGTAAAATTAIQGMVFDPADNRVAPTLTETTTFTISVDDGSGPVTDNTTTVISTSMNDIPTIGGTVAGQAVNDNATISPFSGVTLGDVDNPAQTLTVSVTLDVAAKGTFTTLNGFTDAGGGVYTFSGTAAAATTAIQGMVFDPTDNRVAPTLTETTTFTISVDDGSGPLTDNTTTVISTSINDIPTIGGTVSGQAVNDNATISPFSGVTIGDVDNPAQTLTVSVTLDVAAKGTFTTLNGFTDAGGGVYTFSGTAAAATTAIQGMVFDPADNRVAPTLTETTTFTISVDDGSGPVTDNTTTVISTSMNDAPTATNLSAPETYAEDTPLNLTDIVVSDVDSANVTVTLTLSDVAAGSLSTGTSGAVTSTFVAGVWTASGAIADVNTLLAGVTFNPALNYDSNFTIATSVDDGVAPAITGVKNMTCTPQNDAPTATNLNAGETYTEDTPLNLTDIVVSDVDSANVTVTLTLSDVTAGSLSTGTSGVVTSTFVAGVWTASGAIADVNTLLAGVTFNPALNYDSNFTIATSVDDGVAPAITGVKNMTCTPQNDAPTATNLNAGETYTEDTPLNLTDIVVSDVDSANVTVTLILSDVAAGSLSTGTSGAVTSTFVGGVWTASGAIADVNTLLAGVTFNPALNYDINFTIATSVDDGVAPAITGVKNMTCTPQNDAPTATNLNAGETYTEDTPLNLTDIVVSDVDSANVTVTLILSDVAAGSLSTGTSGAVTSTFVGGVWTASGAIADMNTLLAGVTFNPSLNYTSNFTIATSVDDGVVPAITGVKNITITVISDPPTETLPGPGEDDDTPPIDPIDDPDGDMDIVDDPVEDSLENVLEDAQQEIPTVPQSTPLPMSAKSKSKTPDHPDSKSESTRAKDKGGDFRDNRFLEGRTMMHNQTYTLSGLVNHVAEDLSDIATDIYTSMEILHDSFESMERQEKIVMKTVVGGTLTLSVGLATWILRGGSLVASALTTMPIWKGFDPLPVLTLTKKEQREKIRELRRIEKEERKKHKKVADLLDAKNRQQEEQDREDDKS